MSPGVLFACVLFALQGSASAPPPAQEAAPSAVARIALIGASASAGFNLHVSLCDAIEAQIAVKHAAPMNFAEEAFFLDPSARGEAQVERAAAIDPTLVVAADFLFWFGYGVGGEARRLENLGRGLELLEKLKCPLILSHFPDMTPAVGKMLMPSQVPSKETLVKLNARLDEWAKKRGHVAFVALPEFFDKLRTQTPFKVGELEFKGPDANRRLMQADELHPTVEGLGVLGRLCIDVACEPSIGGKRAEFRSELAPVLESLRKLEETRAPAKRVEAGGEKLPPKPKAGGQYQYGVRYQPTPAPTLRASRGAA